MTWGNVSLEDDYIKISVDGQTVHLNFNKRQFAPSIETIKLDDPRLSKVWGDEIYRITLTAKDLINKGTYNLSVVKQK